MLHYFLMHNRDWHYHFPYDRITSYNVCYTKLLRMIAKQKRKAKFSTQAYTRCNICGRPHSVYRDFGICRVCLRKMANEGLIPGMRKSYNFV